MTCRTLISMHRLAAALGREDPLKAPAQFEQLAALFARLAPARRTRRVVGPLLLMARYLDRLGPVKPVDLLVPMRGRACLDPPGDDAVLVAVLMYDRWGASSARSPSYWGCPACCSTTTGSAWCWGRWPRSRRRPAGS